MNAHRSLNVAQGRGQDKVVGWEQVKLSGDVNTFGNVEAK